MIISTKTMPTKTLIWWHLTSETLISTKPKQWCNRCKSNKNCNSIKSSRTKMKIKPKVMICLVSFQINLRCRVNIRKWICRLNKLMTGIIHLIRPPFSKILTNLLSVHSIHSNLLLHRVTMITLRRKLLSCRKLKMINKKEWETFTANKTRSSKPKERSRIKHIKLFNNFRRQEFNRLNRKREKMPWQLNKQKRNNLDSRVPKTLGKKYAQMWI